MNARVLAVNTLAALQREMERIHPEKAGLEIMLPKGLHRAIKLEGVTCAAANIIKQEMLARGGEAVISSQVYRLKEGTLTEVLLLGSLAHYRGLLAKLRLQPLKSLQAIADEVEAVLADHQGARLGTLQIGKALFNWGTRTYLMGIINVTPDSFSGDGLGYDVAAAVAQGKRFAEEGADLLDVGGESTRPGSASVPVDEELRRVIPVIQGLVRETSVPVSIDTYKAKVAEQALAAGASLVNDVWGLRQDPGLKGVVAQAGVPVILMHNRSQVDKAARNEVVGGHYQGMVYADLMAEICRELRESMALATSAGIPWERIIVDPGIGFGKTAEQNLEILQRLSELKSLGRPILLGTSRKSFIGRVLNLPPDQRLHGTAATVALGIAQGADIVRVHDVKEMAQVACMADAMVRR
ncbi:MAG: dihydropteroate synthase [Chloroflexi bacterium]|nr:dihydropteroate synthase [Chloroflexota bacterium]